MIHIRGNRPAMLRPLSGSGDFPDVLIVKPSSQSITSTTAMTNDTALAVPMQPNEVWTSRFFIAYSGPSVDGKFTVVVPSGASGVVSMVGRDAAGATLIGATTTFGAEFVRDMASGVTHSLEVTCLVRNGENAGNIQFQFAQNSSSATPMTIHDTSFVEAWRYVAP